MSIYQEPVMSESEAERNIFNDGVGRVIKLHLLFVLLC